MTAFYLLKRELRDYIYQEGWQALHPVQEAAIKHAVQTDHHFIIAAPTASGKTEAAFLPAINAVKSFEDGCKIVYISPLVALINDQFKRLFKMCDDMGINVTSWHGEASTSKKKKLLQTPNGILLITPESLEAMLTLRPTEAAALFKQTEWLIVDEIHAFMGTNRGWQLRALIERMRVYQQKSVRYVAMSATLNRDDYVTVKRFFSSARPTDVLLDRGNNQLNHTIDYYETDIRGYAQAVLKRIYQFSTTESMLVFPNARAEVERIAVALKKISQRQQTDIAYFAHHASLSKDIRQMAEQFAKESRGRRFTICCTSTLELGIDIGAVDSVVQYNAPHTVISLAQRLGRSGRHSKRSLLHFIATDPWALLQGLACIELYRQGQLESNEQSAKPYDVLAHQILALLVQYTALPLSTLYHLNHQFKTFASISDQALSLIVNHLIANDYIEILDDEAIIGIAAEPLLRGRHFFAHFNSEALFGVYTADKKIGELPLLPSVQEGVNIILSAAVWHVDKIEQKRKKIFVSPAKDGKPPQYIGRGGSVSGLVRAKMKAIVLKDKDVPQYDVPIEKALATIRQDHTVGARFMFTQNDSGLILRTFMSSKVNQTLRLMLNIKSGTDKYKLDDYTTTLYGPELKQTVLALSTHPLTRSDIETYLLENLEMVNAMLAYNKYACLMPTKLKVDYCIDAFLDIVGANDYLQD